MKRLCTYVLFLTMCLGPATASAGGVAFDVRDLMSANQFHNIGLGKLTQDQIAALNAALPGLEPLAGTDKPFDLRDAMTVNQFHKAGLDALSAEQVAALNSWVNSSLHAKDAVPTVSKAPLTAPVAVPTAATAAAFGATMLAPAAPEPTEIETRILGAFNGWSGNTVFRLENGQVWRQAEPGEFDVKLQDPAVVIKKLAFGYLLSIPGQSDTVFVRRIH
ncbi:MAG TPA: hypothetical protein VFV77_08465 [Gammaproteobacteria bacterium]|nr:hypothetical protein [Gammaproteobacteria bacterium]